MLPFLLLIHFSFFIWGPPSGPRLNNLKSLTRSFCEDLVKPSRFLGMRLQNSASSYYYPVKRHYGTHFGVKTKLYYRVVRKLRRTTQANFRLSQINHMNSGISQTRRGSRLTIKKFCSRANTRLFSVASKITKSSSHSELPEDRIEDSVIRLLYGSNYTSNNSWAYTNCVGNLPDFRISFGYILELCSLIFKSFLSPLYCLYICRS